MIEVFIFLGCSVLRFLPRWLWPKFKGTDSQFHFYYINLIRSNKNKIPEVESRVLGGSNECSYPFLYHWLLSFLPDHFVQWLDKTSGFLFDFLNSLLLLFLLSYLAPISFRDSCLIIGAYMIAPGLTFSFIGPRPFSLTPRNFSQFIFFLGNVLILLGGYYPPMGHAILFILGTLCFSFLLLSSQFGTQVLLFMAFGIIFNFEIGFSIIFSFIFGLFFFKGFLRKQIEAQCQHLKWYFKFNYNFVQHKTNFKKLIDLIKKRDLREIFYELVFYNQISTALLRHPGYFLSLLFGIIHYQTLNSIQFSIFWILVSLFLAFVITNFGRARVFGEAERYIEFCYPLQTLFFISVIDQKHIMFVLYLFLLYNAIWYLYNLYQIKSQHASNYSYENIFSLLENKNPILLCLSNNESYLFLRKTKSKIVGFLVNISLKGNYGKFFQDFFVRYPLVNPNKVNTLCKDFGVTHILKNKEINKNYLEKYENILDSLNDFVLIYDDDKYGLYEKNL